MERNYPSARGFTLDRWGFCELVLLTGISIGAAGAWAALGAYADRDRACDALMMSTRVSVENGGPDPRLPWVVRGRAACEAPGGEGEEPHAPQRSTPPA
jgi:hypothetical protein